MKIKLTCLLITLVMLLPKQIFAQAISLGTASEFVLFSTIGAVTNTGISQITGNVGTNNGASTAFGNVNGGMHDQDSVSAKCATDLLAAYTQLNSAVPTFFPSPALGNGDTLVSGVYSVSGASTLSQVLYLDAKGNSGAQFIFKLQGSFSTAASSKVKLINGALACNVYWKVEGAVIMVSGTTMRGTVIANNAAINMNAGDTLEGRAFSTTGAISVNGLMAYIPVGCGSPVLTGPVAPVLGTAACYAIFSGNGAVSNTGTTSILGDVGTNVGLTTGFDSLLVTGKVHLVPDLSTAQCIIDLDSAYAYINALPYDIELLYPAQFGKSLILTPHTYLLKAATLLSDTLYLNARGNTNAVFVIKINGALTTSTYSKVILVNGAQAKNVFWKVEGGVGINNYSVFRGTIICHNGALGTLNTGVVLDGRALTTAGALTTTAITTVMPTGCMPPAPVITVQPISKTVCSGAAVSFSVTGTGTGLLYQWRKGTVNMVNGSHVTGSVSSTLVINPATIADAALDYNVIISTPSLQADTSVNVALNINTAPAITMDPASQTRCAGDAVSFFVKATGTANTYQWRKGTTNLVNGGNVSNATTDSLIINPMLVSDTSTAYNVVITGTCPPAVTSGFASLILCSTTGISAGKSNGDKVLSIYPNPFTSQITVKLNDANRSNIYQVKIYDVLGTEVINTTVSSQVSVIKTSNLASGMYFYRVLEGPGVIQSGIMIAQ